MTDHKFTLPAAALVAALALLAPAPAAALPDLVPEISDVSIGFDDVNVGDVVEGCATGQFNRRLVQFSLRTYNNGADDLFLGNPGCPNCALNPGAACSNPLFVCGTSHGHAHFESFAKNELLDPEGNVVAEGRKFGFCLLDLECASPTYSCSFQGISAGCSDVYETGLPCQYVDVSETALPDGIYTLRVTLDPDNIIAESNEANNVVEVPLTVGTTPQICEEYPSTDAPKAIPDLGSVTSTLTLPDIGPVTSLRLRLDGTHTFLGDLDATLTSPSATTRTLFAGICNSSDNFNLYLGDDALDPIVCPATDPSVLRTPLETLTPFLGEEAVGDWTLTLSDGDANDTGTLDGWSLEVCAICGNGTVDDGEACDDGNVRGGDCCSSDCLVPALDGAECEDGNECTSGETCEAGTCVHTAVLECDPCLVCDSELGCVAPDLLYPCQEAPSGRSLVQIRHDDADPARDSIRWKWRSETPVELDELGAPDQITDVSLCIYDQGGLVLSSTIPAAQVCNGGEPCWDVSTHAARFSDDSASFDGLSSLLLKEGRAGKIVLKGEGDGLGLDGLFLSLPATIRLIRSDGTPCWAADFPDAQINSESLFKARSE